jgi:hypothetical protein
MVGARYTIEFGTEGFTSTYSATMAVIVLVSAGNAT